ncbi:MAG TPA: HNH endonuclease [Vicinamibacteria bacterium]
MTNTTPSRLSDRELETEVARLARCERESTADLIAHLGELYGRRLHERAGFASLFTYCTRVLLLSEHEAYDRMKAAKVARRYPSVLGLLASGRVNLTTVRLLAPHLTRDNHEGLFAAAAGRRKRQVQELLARMFPLPDVAASVRRLPAVGGTAQSTAPPAAPLLNAPAATPSMEPSRVSLPPTPAPLVRPLSPDRYRITFTASEETTRKLELVQDLLRHAVPNGDPAQIFSRALDALLDDLLKKKFALTDRPRAGRSAGDAAYIPAEVKRTVFIRDGGRCAFVGSHGRHCGERSFLEFHHVIPRAAGGRATVENIELRCRAHNGCEVERFFGPAKRYRRPDDMPEETRTEVVPAARMPVPRGVARVTRFRSGTTRGATVP